MKPEIYLDFIICFDTDTAQSIDIFLLWGQGSNFVTDELAIYSQ